MPMTVTDTILFLQSKGNHIWTIEAKKSSDPQRKWEFREFVPCIKVTPAPFAYVGTDWSWSPRIWSPQTTLIQSTATFSAIGLPSWLTWDGRVLSGRPTEAVHGSKNDIVAKASFAMSGTPIEVELAFSIAVLNVGEDGESNSYHSV